LNSPSNPDFVMARGRHGLIPAPGSETEGHGNICTTNGCVPMKAAMRAQRFELLIELTGFGRFFRRMGQLVPTGYKIDAEIDTATHHLTAKAVVSFTAPETP
jgi:hypothetical protein